MDGYKNVDYFIKASKMGLVPHFNDLWRLQQDDAAYYDLHIEFPIISQNKIDNTSYIIPQGSGTHSRLAHNCIVVNNKTRKYDWENLDGDKIQRLCKSMILKNNLSNL